MWVPTVVPASLTGSAAKCPCKVKYQCSSDSLRVSVLDF